MDSNSKGDETYRGIALVIGNKTFDRPPGTNNIDRDGCDKDITMMRYMFKQLGFDVRVLRNVSAQKMREKIKEASQDERNKESQCFVLGISTHGKETFDENEHVWQHVILGTDRNTVMVEEILEMFDEKNATGLKDKPKIFFIQACRVRYDSGQSMDSPYDKGIRVPESQHEHICCAGSTQLPEPGLLGDGGGSTDHSKQIPELKPAGDASRSTDLSKQIPELEPADDASESTDASNKLLEQETYSDAVPPTDPGNTPQDPFDVLSVKCPKDCLIYYPVESGKKAFRNEDGSIMIKCMETEFPRLLEGCSIIQYLTYVNMALSEYTNHKKTKKITGTTMKKPVASTTDVKITGSYITRLNTHVVFKPLTKNSPMAEAQKWYKVDVQ